MWSLFGHVVKDLLLEQRERKDGSDYYAALQSFVDLAQPEGFPGQGIDVGKLSSGPYHQADVSK